MGFVCLSVCTSYVWHGVCLFVRLYKLCLAWGLSVCCLQKLCLAWGLSVCPSVQVMFGMGFVCLSVCTSYVWHGVCLFVRLYKLCLAWGLSVCCLQKLCLAWGLSVCPSVQVMFGMGFVCLSVCTSYAWHEVCLKQA